MQVDALSDLIIETFDSSLSLVNTYNNPFSYIDDEGASASGDHAELSAERRVLRADAHDEVEGGVCQGVARVEGKDREGAGAGTVDWREAG